MPAQEAAPVAVPVQPAAVQPVEASADDTEEEAPAEPVVAPVQAAQETPAESAPVVEPRVAKVEPRRMAPVDLGNDTFVADEEWSGDGCILRDKERKLLIGQDDIVYLNIGAENGVRPRMRASIYRKGGKVRDPETRDSIGYVVKRVGTIQVTDMVGSQTATAVIVTSEEPILLGDIVKMDK